MSHMPTFTPFLSSTPFAKRSSKGRVKEGYDMSFSTLLLSE